MRQRTRHRRGGWLLALCRAGTRAGQAARRPSRKFAVDCCWLDQPGFACAGGCAVAVELYGTCSLEEMWGRGASPYTLYTAEPRAVAAVLGCAGKRRPFWLGLWVWRHACVQNTALERHVRIALVALDRRRYRRLAAPPRNKKSCSTLSLSTAQFSNNTHTHTTHR